MTRNMIILIICGMTLMLFAAPAYEQSVSGDGSASLSRKQLNKQTNEAHTPEQYRALATYFRQRESSYSAKAAGEKTEWERRKQTQVSVAVKYPTPADSARNLYDYYSYEAAEMAKKAAAYEKPFPR